MKKLFLTLIASVSLLLSVHSQSPVKEWTLNIIPGESYSYTKWVGIYPMKKKPLIAVWLEDGGGRLIKTLYITDRAAENRWRGGAKERPESLPVYYGSRSAAVFREDLDAVSAASKGKAPELKKFQGDFPPETAFIMAEVNISYDYNDFFTKAASGVNGQPSLVYRARWDGNSLLYRLTPAGTGSLDGSDGFIHEDMNGLTSALGLLDSISLQYLPSY